MTTCDKIRPRLTAYLDGDLADEDGSFVRGHLRECPECRQVARDEAALRDGLRMLAPVAPPASLWAGVQAQLAAAEVADARKPRWRRAAARWTRWARWTPTMSQLAAAGLVAAAAIATLIFRAHRPDEPAGRVVVAPPPRGDGHPAPAAALPPSLPSPPSADDVTADLVAEPARTTASYARAVEELMKLTEDDRARWSDGDRAAFDARVAGLREAIARAGQPRSVQRAQRAMIRYLQGAVVSGEVVLASGGAR